MDGVAVNYFIGNKRIKWLSGRERSEIRGQRSEVGGQKSEARSERSEVRRALHFNLDLHINLPGCTKTSCRS